MSILKRCGIGRGLSFKKVDDRSDATREPRRRTSRDTATPISRPVYMIVRSFNLTPVIDVRPR